MGAGSDAGPHFCLGLVFAGSSRIEQSFLRQPLVELAGSIVDRLYAVRVVMLRYQKINAEGAIRMRNELLGLGLAVSIASSANAEAPKRIGATDTRHDAISGSSDST